MHSSRSVRSSSQSGFMLMEVLIAILVFSFGVLAIVGLQATMKKHATDARFRAIASEVAAERVAQVWANASTPPANFLENATDISNQLPNGTRTVTQPVANQFQVTVTWQQPGNDPHQFVTVFYVNGA